MGRKDIRKGGKCVGALRRSRSIGGTGSTGEEFPEPVSSPVRLTSGETDRPNDTDSLDDADDRSCSTGQSRNVPSS
jgi:hypothetical protein